MRPLQGGSRKRRPASSAEEVQMDSRREARIAGLGLAAIYVACLLFTAFSIG
jgi:hypothetical protein